VPAFFTDVERRAVMDAASIAELKVGSSPHLRLE
jgi:molecular chaperone DnaK (HSP70)